MQKTKFGKHINLKFNQDGSVKKFPGNTIICKVNPESKLYKELIKIRDMLMQVLCIKDKYTFLPASSYHMTVIEGLCDEVRKKEYWTKKLPIDVSLEEIDILFKDIYKTIKIPKSFSMRYNEFFIGDIIIVKLLPATKQDEYNLKRFRDEVCKEIGIRFPDHDDYTFHITLAYNIIEPRNKELSEIELIKENIHNYLSQNICAFKTSQPKLVFFKNMFRFTEYREKA